MASYGRRQGRGSRLGPPLIAVVHGLHGWAWGIGIGGGKEPDWNGVWIVFSAAPEEITHISGGGGQEKAKRGTIEFVSAPGDWQAATNFILAGQIAWIEHASSGAASATGESGAASATGESGAASATGESGAASATGESGAASATGYRGAASATGHSGAASATGESGAASATGYRGAASATGYRGAASATGYRGAASATGHRGAASATGHSGAASATGESGAASATGYRGAASATGESGAASATGHRGAAFVTGLDGRARSGKYGCVALAYWNGAKSRGEMRCREVGCGDGSDGKLKADTWYRLDKSGEFVRGAVVTATVDREQFLAERRTGIGGSDVAAMFSIGYGCRLALWRDKRNQTPDFPDETTGPMELGKILEPYFADKYAEITGRSITAPGVARHPDQPELLVHVDRLIYDAARGSEPGVLEIKSVGRGAFYRYKREGIPEDYILQLQHGMLVTGLRWGAFAIGCRDFGVTRESDLLRWDVERDGESVSRSWMKVPFSGPRSRTAPRRKCWSRTMIAASPVLGGDRARVPRYLDRWVIAILRCLPTIPCARCWWSMTTARPSRIRPKEVSTKRRKRSACSLARARRYA